MSTNGKANLSNVHGCLQALSACNDGLAYLDHLWHLVLDDVGEAEEEWEAIEAQAAGQARLTLPSAATAIEIRGRITEFVNADPSRRQVRDRVREARRRKAKVERFFRSVEKRLGAAQSAQKGHEQLSRYGGAP